MQTAVAGAAPPPGLTQHYCAGHIKVTIAFDYGFLGEAARAMLAQRVGASAARRRLRNAALGVSQGLYRSGDTLRRSEHLHGLNFVLTDALEGGVNSSLNLDSPRGKSFSYLSSAEIEKA